MTLWYNNGRFVLSESAAKQLELNRSFPRPLDFFLLLIFTATAAYAYYQVFG